MTKKQWKVKGYKGTKVIFEAKIPNYSEKEVQVILQRLLSRTLSFDEIVSGSKRRRIQFEVFRETTSDCIMLRCGDNPHFIAHIPMTRAKDRQRLA